MNNEKKSKSLSDLLSTTIYTSAAVFALIFIWKRTLYKPSTLNWNGWAFYEWLINYEGGFVRRGLIGSLINTYYFNSEIIAINTLVFWGAFIFIVLTTLFVSNKIKSIKSTLLFTFCPIGFYWMAIGNEYYYRKEIIFLIAILCSCLAFLNWKKTASRLVPPLLTAFIFLISGLLLLIHESFIFYGCLIFSLILFEFHQNNSIIRKKVILAYILLCLIIFGILSIYKGDENTSLAIWNSLSNSVKTLREYSSPAGGISAIGWSLVKGLSLSLSAILSGMVTYYIFPILIIYLYLGFIIADYRNYKLKNIYFSKNFSIPFLTIIISFSPLFLLGWDWGRWIMGIWYISLFIFLLELDERILYLSSLFISNPEKILPYLFFYLLLFLGIFTGVPECCISASGGSLLNIPGLKNLLNNL